MSKKKKKKKVGVAKSMIEENRRSKDPKKPHKIAERKLSPREKKLKSVRLFHKLHSLRYVTLTVEGEPKRFDLKSEFCLTPESISDRFYIEAEQFMTFRSLLSIARAKLAEARDSLILESGAVELAHRKYAEKENNHYDPWYFKRETDVNDVVKKKRKEVLRWEREVDLLEAIVSGLEILKSMVISASAQDRNHTRYLNREED